MKKMLPILALVGIALVGCAPVATTPEEATKANSENSNYTIEYVQVEDKTIRCLWHNKQPSGHTTNMSCDWDNPVVE